ncbi:MAG: prepilin-type N-terminal cleavage/methylation domain-containing protein [Gemmatimonadales bacterium]|nr:MAG: prepilin-type N-terminal cleavage/methylation domain-containing protein [Gemmatimonadales bacterium]
MAILRNRNGFTFIEMLAVLVVLGILAVIAVPRLFEVRYEAFRTAAMSDLRNMTTAQEVYRGSQDRYAWEIGDLDFDQSAGVGVNITEASGTGWAAVARHGSFPASECGIFVGTASAANAGPATAPGQIICSR